MEWVRTNQVREAWKDVQVLSIVFVLELVRLAHDAASPGWLRRARRVALKRPSEEWPSDASWPAHSPGQGRPLSSLPMRMGSGLRVWWDSCVLGGRRRSIAIPVGRYIAPCRLLCRLHSQAVAAASDRVFAGATAVATPELVAPAHGLGSAGVAGELRPSVAAALKRHPRWEIHSTLPRALCRLARRWQQPPIGSSPAWPPWHESVRQGLSAHRRSFVP